MQSAPDDSTGANAAVQAILFKLGAVGLFQVMGALVKLAGESGMPTTQLVFARSFFAFLPIFWLLQRQGGLPALRTKNPLGHGLRCAAGICAMFCGFTALTLAPLADVVAVGFSASLFTTVFAAVILRERVGVYRWGAVMVGFLGVMIMLEPNSLFDETMDNATFYGLVIALVGALFVALATISVRHLARNETPVAIIFYFTLTCTLVSGVMLPFSAVAPSQNQAIILISIGVVGGVAQILMTRSYVLAPASLVAPFDYTAMIYAAAIGIALFSEWPSLNVLAGAALVIVAGLVILYRERRLGLARGIARKRGVGPIA